MCLRMPNILIDMTSVQLSTEKYKAILSSRTYSKVYVSIDTGQSLDRTTLTSPNGANTSHFCLL